MLINVRFFPLLQNNCNNQYWVVIKIGTNLYDYIPQYISLIFKGVLPKQPCCFEIDNDKGLKEPLETKEPLINKTLHFHLNSYYGLVEEQWVV